MRFEEKVTRVMRRRMAMAPELSTRSALTDVMMTALDVARMTTMKGFNNNEQCVLLISLMSVSLTYIA